MVAMTPSDTKENGAAEAVAVFECDKDELRKRIDTKALMADVDRKRPKDVESENPAECTVVIDNLPVVGADKMDKLKSVVHKLYRQLAPNAHAHFPADADGRGKGFCLLATDSPDAAAAVVAGLHGHRLDKKHKFAVHTLAALQAVEPPPDAWTAPAVADYKEPGDLWWWLKQDACVDQFALFYKDGAELTVFANSNRQATIVKDRSNWAEHNFQWSPRGAYLATFHSKGIALWGGQEFDKIARFTHENVEAISFSPCESYVVTYSPNDKKYAEYDSKDGGLRVWEVRSGDLVRSFAVGGTDGLKVDSWPFLKWSSTSEFFAFKRDSGIVVYQMKACTIVDKHVIKVPEVRSVEWSPARPLLAYCSAEQEASKRPARVAIIDFTTADKAELCSRNVFNVARARLRWQPSGERLAVESMRFGKKRLKKNAETKKETLEYSSISYTLDILHVNMKDAPSDNIELWKVDPAIAKDDEPVDFAWEPHGDRFCILLGNSRLARPVFFTTKSQSGASLKSEVLKVFEPMQAANCVKWSPQGGWAVAASLKTSAAPATGAIAFFDTSAGEVAQVNKQDYVNCTDLKFDPTGRFVAAVAACVDAGKGGDYSYVVYTSQGRHMRKRVTVDVLLAFEWRPRPPSLLDDEHKRRIKRALKAYMATFEKADKQEGHRASEAVLKQRRELRAEWRTRLEAEAELRAMDAGERERLRGQPEDVSEELVEETVEIPVKTTRALKHVATETLDDDDMRD